MEGGGGVIWHWFLDFCDCRVARMLFVFLICLLAFLDFCDCQVARILFVFFNTVSGGGFWTL